MNSTETSTKPAATEPSPQLFFDTVNAFQRTAALKTAIELDLFSQIGADAAGKSAADVAAALKAPERGVRILCDFLTIIGFLSKRQNRYALTPDAAKFLDRHSPAYVGGAIDFLLSPKVRQAYDELTSAVRRGTTALPGGGAIEAESAMWVDFARGMAPLQFMPAQLLADLTLQKCKPMPSDRPVKILDLAAGHGLFGIALAQRL